MREIKFRAWKHVNTPEMFNDVQVIDFKSGIAHLGYSLSSFTKRTDKERLDNLILMQYTGLKDKNGVEIYEGDIVLFDSKLYPVTFKNGNFGVNKLMKVNLYTDEMREYQEPLWNLVIDGCEVIGNIYEDRELLERDGE